MTRTRVLAALLAGLTLAGLGTAATALGSDDPTSTAAPVAVVAPARAATPADTSKATVTRITDDDRGAGNRTGDDRGRHGGDDRSDDHGGRHGSDDGPGHDRFDDKGRDH